VRVAGDEVNLASKLGEDVAGADEILLTPAARAELPDAACSERHGKVGEIDVTYYVFET
jgi:class 3 adenylate cyclase